MTEAAKLTAITGMIAAAGHQHRGIKPSTDLPIPPMKIEPAHNVNAAVATSMASAAQLWPDCNSWDLVGCDAIDPQGQWQNAITYASWPTYDIWNSGAEPDGFSNGS